MLAKLLFSILFFGSPLLLAQVATTPIFLDQRIINPATSAGRQYLGFEADVNHYNETAKVLELVESSIEIKTTIDTINSNNAFKFGKFFFEFNFSPQQGKKDTISSADAGSSSSNLTKLNLIPVQFLVATEFNQRIKLGLRLNYTYFNLDDETDLIVRTIEKRETILDNKSFKGNFLTLSPGFVYQFGTSGFSVGYVAEFMQLTNQQKILGDYTVEGTTGNKITRLDTQSKDSFIVRKDVLGLGYSTGKGTGNNFRTDISYERMPPVTRTSGYKVGEMTRFVTEATFTFFRFGVEFTRKSGYYVDPYRLIPYFFKLDHLGSETTQEFGFFGGLKTARGNSFGAFASFSNAKVSEQLSVGSDKQNIEKKSTNFGLSYSYVY